MDYSDSNDVDLRDFMCVSRLSITDSGLHSEDGYEGLDHNRGLETPFLDNRIETPSLLPNVHPFRPVKLKPLELDSPNRRYIASPDIPNNEKKLFKKNKNSKRNRLPLPSLPQLSTPSEKAKLPPICKQNENHESNIKSLLTPRNPVHPLPTDPILVKKCLDRILKHVDSSMINKWLTECNAKVKSFKIWCQKGDNFVTFANFWLREVTNEQKEELADLELSIVLDEVDEATKAGYGSVTKDDGLLLVMTAFPEFTTKLKSASQGPHFLLNILSILSGPKNAEYKALLTDIKYSTRNPSHIQGLLAVRGLCMINICHSTLHFYRQYRLQDGEDTDKKTVLEDNFKSCNMRMKQAVSAGFISVVNYLIRTGKVNPDTYQDPAGKGLVFLAVADSQHKMLDYLLSEASPGLDLNLPASNGNTPLHAAVNVGDATSVVLLCRDARVDINCVNGDCENATPLHLAAMYGHYSITRILLAARADTYMLIGNRTALDVAREHGHEEIIEVLLAATDGEDSSFEDQ